MSPDEAAAEVLRRREIRRSLVEWCRHCGYEPAAHQLLLISYLEKIARGEINRLIVCMPPGSAKSTYTSILLPPWFLANNPHKSIIAASHTIELAEKWGRRGRNLVSDNSPTLNIAISSDSQAAGRWALTSGGEYLSAGVGTAIAGFRADLALIDDPIRSREDADSENARERTYDWYRSDLAPRLKPGGRVILIQTRWHEDDLAGRLLAKMEGGGEHWDVVSLPAEAEPNDPLGREVGEMLWGDDDYGYANSLRQEKATQPAYNWSALYQQRPSPESGEYFQASWLKPYAPHELPDLATLSVFGASDYAVSEGRGDYTCHVVVGIDPEDRMFVLDLWRGQKAPDFWVEAFCDLVLKWKPQGWAEEQGQIKSAIGPFLENRMSERRAYVARAKFPTKGDKSIRAQSIRGRMAVKGLYVPTYADWYPDFRAELLGFPAAKHDDMVDSISLIGQIIDKMWKGSPLPQQQTKPKILSFEPGKTTLTLTDLFQENERRH
jgi:predicted phage terminase large subunit-like protein